MSDYPRICTPHPRRILVRGVNWLGDAVMTAPALQRLRQALPDAHITLLTPDRFAPLWQHHPCIDAVMPFDSQKGPLATAHRLRAGAFDIALVLPNSHRSALEVWLAGIPCRIGYAQPWRNWLLTQPLPPRPGHAHMSKRSFEEIHRLARSLATLTPSSIPGAAHQIHDYLHLAAALGANPEPLAPKLEVSAAELQQAEDSVLTEWRNRTPASASGQPPILLGLIPGAEYGPAKRWPAESFAAAARAVSQQIPASLWLALGGPADEPVCESIARLTDGSVLNLAGKTSLRQLMALLKLCRLVLTNDTGPMHVAAALGTPVVVPFGSTSPELTGAGLPGDPRHHLLKSDAPCSPCFLRDCPIDFRCMTGITPARVTESVLQLLSPR